MSVVDLFVVFFGEERRREESFRSSFGGLCVFFGIVAIICCLLN